MHAEILRLDHHAVIRLLIATRRWKTSLVCDLSKWCVVSRRRSLLGVEKHATMLAKYVSSWSNGGSNNSSFSSFGVILLFTVCMFFHHPPSDQDSLLSDLPLSHEVSCNGCHLFLLTNVLFIEFSLHWKWSFVDDFKHLQLLPRQG